MASFRLEHIPNGWLDVFKSPGVQAEVDEAGARIAANAGEYYRYYPKPGNFTGMGFVSSTGPSGNMYEAMDKRLTRAVHS